MNYFKHFVFVIREVVRRPTQFFTSVAKEKSFLQAFLWYLGFLALSKLFMLLYVLMLFYPLAEPAGITQTAIPLALKSLTIILAPKYLLLFISGIIWIFIRVFIFWFLLWLFRGKGSFIQTFNGIIYAQSPMLLIAPFYLLLFPLWLLVSEWIILVILPVIIWVAWLRCTAMSIAHKISKWRAFAALYIVPFLFIFLLIRLIRLLPLPLLIKVDFIAWSLGPVLLLP